MTTKKKSLVTEPQFTLKDLTAIKQTIASCLLKGHMDWEDRIEVQIKSGVRFKTMGWFITIGDDNVVYMACADGRKVVKFPHQNIIDTENRIRAEITGDVDINV